MSEKNKQDLREESVATGEQGTASENKITFSQRLSAPERENVRKCIHFLFTLVPILSILIEIFSPICDVYITKSYYTLRPSETIEYINDKKFGSYAYLSIAVLLVLIVCAVIIFAMIIRSLLSFRNETKMIRSAKISLTLGAIITVLYSSVGLFAPMIIYTAGGNPSKVNISFTALILTVLAVAVYAAFIGMVSIGQQQSDENVFEKKARERRENLFSALRYRKIELTVYVVCSAAVAIVALLSNIITISIRSNSISISNHSVTGISLLQNPEQLTTVGERMLAFFVFALLLACATLAVMSIISLFSRSVFFSKIAIATAVVCTLSSMLVGLFGRYYSIVQNMNIETIRYVISQYSTRANEIIEEIIQYEVKSTSIWWFVICLGILVILFFRRPYSKIIEIEGQIAAEDASMLPQTVEISSISGGALAPEDAFEEENSATEEESAEYLEAPLEPVSPIDFEYDPCPVFSQIDAEVAALKESRDILFEEPTLPRLVDFIVQYARNSKNHLFYTHETIAAFLAGLGSTRLSILQGMSGTGKTSLPKIVAEALCSVCDIIEVESSWRDKNELLGYYNEFSKMYTPKKFTRALYRAGLCSDRITFIVLDEMNLSRIEYYFSDFLSLMENDPDKRELRLINLSISRTHEGEQIPYRGLRRGHTLKVPANVWFIGTANRDESTYDISDKVYDRAHTMNFDKRATKMQYFSEELPARYISADELIRLFDEAKSNVTFELDQYPIVVEVEKLLEPYNISFGNRVAMQMESFVKIYASCFAVNESIIKDGLETILLSKVVRKLELKRIDDKDALAAEFDKLHLTKCSEFIRGIKED